MPFPERNPPDIPILPGPQYNYLNSTPPPGQSKLHISNLTFWSFVGLHFFVQEMCAPKKESFP
jgi:hypothetical protein